MSDSFRPFTPEEEAEFEAEKPRLAKKQRKRWCEEAEDGLLAATDYTPDDCFEDEVDAVTDMLTRLMHFCDDRKIEFEKCLNRAEFHHEAECDDDDDILASYLLELMNEEEGL